MNNFDSDENIIINANKEDIETKYDIEEAQEFEQGLLSEDKAELEPQDDIFAGVSLEDTMKLYMKEVSQQNRLSQEQEKALLKQKIDAQKILLKKKLPISLPATPEVISKIKKDTDKKTVKQGGAAVTRLIECNLRLVISVAKHYKDKGIPVLDLIQEGNIGLIKGVEKFDTVKGCKLSTYITWWIRHYIARYLTDNSRNIRIPSNIVQQILKINKIKSEYFTKYGEEISNKQLARKMKLSEGKLANIMLIPLNTISTDATIDNGEGDDSDTTIGDLIADESSYTQDDIVRNESLRESLDDLISQLTPKEQQIIKMRYGFDDGYVRTLEEVSQILNMSKERIRQLEDKALHKLKFYAKDAGITSEMFSD